MVHLLPLLALAAPLVAAIDFASPIANATLTKGTDVALTWNSVDTDPTTFSVYLVNFVNWPPFYTPLAFGVNTAAGQTTVKLPCNVDNSWGYQFNAINGTNVYIIYAQTERLFITGAPCVDTTPPLDPCGASTMTATVTVTVSRPVSPGSSSSTGPKTTTSSSCPGLSSPPGKVH